MIDIFTWMKKGLLKDKPFLILGKGPSFSLRNKYTLSEYNVISLNHVVREQKVDIAHIIDIDVVESCANVLDAQAKWLLMPFVPHINCRPTCLKLNDVVDTMPILQKFDKEQRLLWYPLWSGPNVDNIPHVNGTFSGSVVVDLLSKLGASEVKSLGLDGGANYSETFEDLNDVTLFKNGHRSFDIQHSEIKESVRKSKMTYEQLEEPIRVFIACSDTEMVASYVLEHSIRKHTTAPLQIFHMRNMPTPIPKDKKNIPGTSFSFNRFLIPKLAGYTGKAIYLDSDMLVFGDIRDLWSIPFNGNKVLCSTQEKTPRGWENGNNNDLGEGRYWTPGRQLSVMLLDCEQLDWDIEKIVSDLDAGTYSYKELMARLCIVDEDNIGDNIPNEWNCLEWYEKDRSKLVHFTVVPTQPWRNDRGTLSELWMNACEEALSDGAVPADVINESISKNIGKASLIALLNKYQKKTVSSEHNSSEDKQESSDEIESTRLRHMLWDSMIEGFTAQKELNRIKSSPAFWLEETLVRRPWAFGMRVMGWAGRRLRF